MDKFSKLPLRKGVGIVVLNKKNEIFVAKRIDNPKNFWQMPQGGIDPGEKAIDAAYRELYEETNIKNVELLKEVQEELTYILPDNLLGIIWKGRYKGQKQKWYIMRFIGKEKEININKEVILSLIRYYTREAGVRGLERQIAKILRKVVKERLLSKKNTSKSTSINDKNLEKYSGVRKFKYGIAEKDNAIGQVTGLAWTEVGGELLTIEASSIGYIY